MLFDRCRVRHPGDRSCGVLPGDPQQPRRQGAQHQRDLRTLEQLRRTALDPEVDAGVVHPSATDVDGVRRELFTALCAAGRNTLVLRPCYLALRRAMEVSTWVDGVVVVSEPDRALDAHDVERLLGARVLASLDVDPAVARAVDAGLLVQRRHRGIQRAVEASA